MLTMAPRRSLIWGTLVSGWLLTATCGAQSPDACLQAELAAQPEFSGVVLVRQRGQARVAVRGQGEEADTSLQADSRFNLGSASKMFTAVAVMQLVAQGELTLDAPIGRWVEGLAPPVAAVTLRQLLTHSGGLGNFFVPENLAALQKARTLSEQMALVDDVRPLFEPGTRFRYSNTGFLLLGLAVERASGQTFATYLRDQLFKPADMTQTSLDPAQPTVAAIGYTRLPAFEPGAGPGGPGGSWRPAVESSLPGSPAGGAYSTAADLARFFDALESGRLVSADGLRELTDAHITASHPGAPLALQYGLGFAVSGWEGHRGFGHNGGAPGVNVEAMRYPESDVLIVVLSNRDPPLAGQILATLRRKGLGGTLCP